MMMAGLSWGTWIVSAIALIGVIFRPMGLLEWGYAVAGAAVLILTGLLPAAEGLGGVLSGLDVYLFLAGMMLLAETARQEGLFDYLAAFAARLAKGSPYRLFTLVYFVGTAVTVFLSNDATVVVLTPAVIAVTRRAGVSTPLPYLLTCAFVANAASFALPISNPANLVVFGDDMPALGDWLARFAFPSVVAILCTFYLLRFTQRRHLRKATATEVAIPQLERGGRFAAAGLAVAVIVLLTASATGTELGIPTLAAGCVTALAVVIGERRDLLLFIRGISWGTLALVAGLFVIVRALEFQGLTSSLVAMIEQPLTENPVLGAFATGVIVAVWTNLANNLPLGLLAGAFTASAHLPRMVIDAMLIGIDLGPNLSVTGSLATILWLTALRREGMSFGSWNFLKLGLVIMPPTLVLTLAASLLVVMTRL